ncbi:MAG: primosomal protein N' [Candidatus Saccharibacteria bacterium]|nr:primosomal protein N' [Candidatus Saccharibacteria bacterium]
MFYEVLVSKIFRKSANVDDGILTYASDASLSSGQVVLVPLGRSIVAGIVYRKVSKPSFEAKGITKVLYDQTLPKQIVESVLWINQYYLTPLPQVVSLVLPNGVEKKRRLAKAPSQNPLVQQEKIPLNAAQKKALKELLSQKCNTRMLHGVTGSGKTNIYLTMAIDIVKAGKSVILLVPEIALTSQLVQIFQKFFGSQVQLIHSKQTEAERHLIWQGLLEAEEPKVVVGPRSALFAPLKDLGLIIVDEAHESTYFQESPPKYSALRLASFMAKELDIPCIYGTATPLVTDYYVAKKHNSYVQLTEKAKETAKGPDVTVIDFKDRANFNKNRYFSDVLLAKITENLEAKQQTLIFHNRRGSANVTMCEQCGWQALCPDCFLPLTLHADKYKLVCHTCGRQEKIPVGCPECKSANIIYKGFGTKLIESEIKKLFPKARVARFDTDNDKTSSLEAQYEKVKKGEIDIIIGTQTVARGFDFPKLATVGVVQADAGLSLPDYASEERTFHLLTQVLGRVGRGHLEVADAIIQTYQPDHPVIQAALDADYDQFAKYLLDKRRKSHMPPFMYLAKISVVYKTEKTTLTKIKQVYRDLRGKDGVFVSQPTPSFHERTPSGYSWQLIVRSPSRAKLLKAIRELSDFSNVRFTIDPPSLL